MTLLQIMPEDAPDQVLLRTTDDARITSELAAHGVSLRRWDVRSDDTPTLDDAALLELYRDRVDEVCAKDSMKLVDIARLHPAPTEEWRERAATARRTFLEEHRHSEDEVRFFAHGRGMFTLHLDARVFAVVCEAGDLLSVPAGTRHWFDMGETPDFAAIRFFQEEDGWVGDFTGTPIAGRFPRLDDIVGSAE
ncbi:acireductone dioxygenase [Streptomyces griseofuscus]|uniref:Acireductone dioxygenase n=1 Tax=Streptomyces griseofuscus TaxID=146922 RepID=A0A7H1PTB1_9ACTN|nr:MULTISPECIES: cupin [Streptomyces]MBA9049596.1 1,2-dihydroxy-3-keto-5-methylthiopentene dioxygenase [Streptomyces murinus]QNT91291.1 cupin domain-containing protein [Streptomyces griseofuscus]BBC92170.1 cupin [Streptomyces rochei]